MKPKRLKCISCDVLARPVYHCAAHSPHIVDVVMEQFGLHSAPNQLRSVLQKHIDDADASGVYDAVVLAYGLCGKATHGLQAGSLPLVIPRAHDCITLFLGGREKYAQEFNACPGTYWYVQDYVERGESAESPLSMGALTAQTSESVYAEYVEKYGADNADYLMEVMGAWHEHYERAAYIDMQIGEREDVANRALRDAENRGWRFEKIAGDLVLIRILLNGDWDDEEFLILEPGQRIEMADGDDVVQAGK